MLTTAFIAFREFFEAFLIIGVFLGVSRTLNLRREFEIGLAAATGIGASLLLIAGTYFFGSEAEGILTERNADLLESYLLVFSGFFIAYVVFSLHRRMHKSRSDLLAKARGRLAEEAFDVSLFFTIALIIFREGFEIALFTSSVSLFSQLLENLIALLAGFSAAAVLGAAAFLAYVKLPVSRIFRWTEYFIILLGASLTEVGLTKLFATGFGVALSDVLPFHFSFLPGEDTALGNLLQSFLGVDQGFSGARLAVMLAYIIALYLLFLRPRAAEPQAA